MNIQNILKTDVFFAINSDNSWLLNSLHLNNFDRKGLWDKSWKVNRWKPAAKVQLEEPRPLCTLSSYRSMSFVLLLLCSSCFLCNASSSLQQCTSNILDHHARELRECYVTTSQEFKNCQCCPMSLFIEGSQHNECQDDCSQLSEM